MTKTIPSNVLRSPSTFFVQCERNASLQTQAAVHFAQRMVVEAMKYIRQCPKSNQNSRRKLFELICMCIICDPSGSTTTGEVPIKVLLEQSLWFVANAKGMCNAHFYKTIVLCGNIKLSTVLVAGSEITESLSAEENSLQLSRHLVQLLHEICEWIGSNDDKCDINECYVCSIFATARQILPPCF